MRAATLKHSWNDACPVAPEQLVMVTMSHRDYDGRVRTGRLVVARSQADNVIRIFRRLYEIGYPINSMIPIGDLPPGIEDTDPSYDNTSGLHCRFIAGTTKWSEHAKGLAIDINPFRNPYKSSTVLWPANAGRYLDRALGEPGMIVAGDDVVAAFASNGWSWGGAWTSIKDYHHFSVSGN